MTTSNNVNVELRPGTRLIRETHGGREVMWVEENSIFGSGSGSGSWVLAMLVVLGLMFVVFSPTEKPKQHTPSYQTTSISE